MKLPETLTRLSFSRLSCSLFLLSISAVSAFAVELCGENVPTRYIQDLGHDRRWAVIRDCVHPERPERLLPVAPETTSKVQEHDSYLPANLKVQNGLSLQTVGSPIVVRAGSQVELHSEAPNLHLALQGTALDSGSAGATVRVRLHVGGAVLSGWVRDASTVEFQPASKKGFHP